MKKKYYLIITLLLSIQVQAMELSDDEQRDKIKDTKKAMLYFIAGVDAEDKRDHFMAHFNYNAANKLGVFDEPIGSQTNLKQNEKNQDNSRYSYDHAHEARVSSSLENKDSYSGTSCLSTRSAQQSNSPGFSSQQQHLYSLENRGSQGKREPDILFKEQICLQEEIIQALQAHKIKEQKGEEESSRINRNPITLVEDNEGQYSLMTGDHSGLYGISQEMARLLCRQDRYGSSLPKDNVSGTHQVISKGNVHFKLSPAQDEGGAINDIRPGMEYAVSSFYRLFTVGLKNISLAPPTTLLVLNNIAFKNLDLNSDLYSWVSQSVIHGKYGTLEAFLDRNPNVRDDLERNAQRKIRMAIIQASRTVPGEGLDTFLKGNNLKNLDRAHFSALVISSLITGSSDGKADNYRIGPSGESHNAVQPIDNDENFVPSIKRLKNGEHHPQLKSVLFFLPLMEERIDQKIVKHISDQSPEILLYCWLQALEDQNRRVLSHL